MIYNSLVELQTWYKNQCDGDWEHDYGIKIETLDNPGWYITIDLEGTDLEELTPFNMSDEKNDKDWYSITVKERKFLASGDPTKLEMLISSFLNKVKDQTA